MGLKKTLSWRHSDICNRCKISPMSVCTSTSRKKVVQCRRSTDVIQSSTYVGKSPTKMSCRPAFFPSLRLFSLSLSLSLPPPLHAPGSIPKSTTNSLSNGRKHVPRGAIVNKFDRFICSRVLRLSYSHPSHPWNSTKRAMATIAQSRELCEFSNWKLDGNFLRLRL